MNIKTGILPLVAVLTLIMTGGTSRACTWAAFHAPETAIVARTMDWTIDDHAVVRGHGRGGLARTADTPNAVEYSAKYASLQIDSFRGVVAEAMNEKGLQGSILFLDGSVLPAPKPGRVDVDPNRFLAYAVSSFATVKELVDHLDEINFIPAPLSIPDGDGRPLEYPPEQWPGHFALADANGDKAVIEFIDGEVKLYFGPEHDALSNEPPYAIHQAFDFIGYRPTGSISTIDRRSRAKNYLRDMHERGVDSPRRALLAMRGLLAGVTSGTEAPDPEDGEVYPTLWTALADQKTGKYYVSRYDRWCSEIYDFSMFASERPEVVTLAAEGCPAGPKPAADSKTKP